MQASPSDPPPAGLLTGAALFLDFDGTLVELAETPDAIRVHPELLGLLQRLAANLEGRLAIVSGRAIADLEQHMDCGGLAISGSHGLELRLADGTLIPLAAPLNLAGLKEEIRAFAASSEGLLVEEKPASVALHFRQAPEEAERIAAFMSGLAKRSGLTLQEGKMVLELRPKGADKGDAVRALMLEPEFTGARPLFVGDDLTDEDAFEAVAALGGAGVLVGPPRPSAATYRLDDVSAVAEWLKSGA